MNAHRQGTERRDVDPIPFASDDRSWRGLLDHGQSITVHRHRHGQLVYPASGLLITTTDRGTWATPADQIVWTPPGCAHEHRTYGMTDIRIAEVPRHRCGPLPPRPGSYTVSPLLREAVLRLTGGTELTEDRRTRLREVIVDEMLVMPEQPLHLPEPTDDRLRAVTRRLHDHPETGLTLAQLGRQAGASERTLSRLFAAELGMSFQQWRTLLRVQRALIYLARGTSVTDTAIALGWSNPTSFITSFRTVVGQTPGRYVNATRASR